jgi:hypothetical protein
MPPDINEHTTWDCAGSFTSEKRYRGIVRSEVSKAYVDMLPYWSRQSLFIQSPLTSLSDFGTLEHTMPLNPSRISSLKETWPYQEGIHSQHCNGRMSYLHVWQKVTGAHRNVLYQTVTQIRCPDVERDLQVTEHWIAIHDRIPSTGWRPVRSAQPDNRTLPAHESTLPTYPHYCETEPGDLDTRKDCSLGTTLAVH